MTRIQFLFFVVAYISAPAVGQSAEDLFDSSNQPKDPSVIECFAIRADSQKRCFSRPGCSCFSVSELKSTTRTVSGEEQQLIFPNGKRLTGSPDYIRSNLNAAIETIDEFGPFGMTPSNKAPQPIPDEDFGQLLNAAKNLGAFDKSPISQYMQAQSNGDSSETTFRDSNYACRNLFGATPTQYEFSQDAHSTSQMKTYRKVILSRMKMYASTTGQQLNQMKCYDNNSESDLALTDILENSIQSTLKLLDEQIATATGDKLAEFQKQKAELEAAYSEVISNINGSGSLQPVAPTSGSQPKRPLDHAAKHHLGGCKDLNHIRLCLTVKTSCEKHQLSNGVRKAISNFKKYPTATDHINIEGECKYNVNFTRIVGDGPQMPPGKDALQAFHDNDGKTLDQFLKELQEPRSNATSAAGARPQPTANPKAPTRKAGAR